MVRRNVALNCLEKGSTAWSNDPEQQRALGQLLNFDVDAYASNSDLQTGQAEFRIAHRHDHERPILNL
jgi:hypothetical protein